MFQAILTEQVDVLCRDCGKSQRRHSMRATLPAVCFDCKTKQRKQATKAKKIRSRLQSPKDDLTKDGV
jgi:hypothetical protein